MLIPIKDVINPKQKLVTAREDELIREVVLKMIDHDYSQLPVVDKDGSLTGIVSEQSIIRTSLYKPQVLDLQVKHCSEPPRILAKEDDLFDALELLEKTSAVVIVNRLEPVGILTNYDATLVFQRQSESLLRVEEIELMLREFIGNAFPTKKLRDEAIQKAFSHFEKDDKKLPDYDQLTFQDYITIITNKHNWGRFEETLELKDLFTKYMEGVRDIRNQLAHFRGKADTVQMDLLKRAQNWLRARKGKNPQPTTKIDRTGRVDLIEFSGQAFGQWDDWLTKQAELFNYGTRIQQPFEQIEQLLGRPMPDSALEYQSWWSDADDFMGLQAEMWQKAGWVVEHVDLEKEQVVFRRSEFRKIREIVSCIQEILSERFSHLDPDRFEFNCTYDEEFKEERFSVTARFYGDSGIKTYQVDSNSDIRAFFYLFEAQELSSRGQEIIWSYLKEYIDGDKIRLIAGEEKPGLFAIALLEKCPDISEHIEIWYKWLLFPLDFLKEGGEFERQLQLV